MTKDKYEKGLKQYLGLETLLNQFFQKVNFCEEHCVKNPKSNDLLLFFAGGIYIRGDIGCCLDDHFNSHSKHISDDDLCLLDKKRVEKYGRPEKTEEEFFWFGKPCSYHTKEEGCILKDHKGPVCNGEICDIYRDHLKENYGINYNKLHIVLSLEQALAGKLTNKELKELKNTINSWITTINQSKTPDPDEIRDFVEKKKKEILDYIEKIKREIDEEE